MSRVLLACGGTGGHLAPGIALAQRLTDEGHACLLIVSRKSVDARMTAGYPRLGFIAGTGRGFGPGLVGKLLFFPALLRSVWSAWRLQRSFKPDVLVCFGGFMSVGPAVAARLGGIPVLVHEANRRPGKAVRLIARLLARSVHLPEGVRLPGVPSERQHASGYPVRAEVRPMPQEAARQALGMPVAGRMLLVVGGSQGAAALTRWVGANLGECAERGVHVLCLTGPGGRQEEIRAGSSLVRFLPFCDRMAEAYASADLVVARAGAGTLAELAACRAPAILVPLPSAADDHQTANARHFSERGAAWLVPEAELPPGSARVFQLLSDDGRLGAMRDALARLDAENRWEGLFRQTLDLAAPGGPRP